ncbi:MAG: hypothetical protein EXR54_04625 [Dehalococcoidia bacterium]|nr:hypothetical protein [Dehalococcoidia bacterium]MSQ16836.1 hypothetical protein [Dehalococcoidia bacterium]
MATKIAGETYLGDALHLPLSQDGQVTAYVWPMRILKSGCGGPTIGVEVGNEEVLRWDCHDRPGHWHKGGYDKLGARGSHVEFPEDVREIDLQVAFAIAQITDAGSELLSEAGYAPAAEILDAKLVKSATAKIRKHIRSQGDLRTQALEKKLLKV